MLRGDARKPWEAWGQGGASTWGQLVRTGSESFLPKPQARCCLLLCQSIPVRTG